MYHDDEDEDLKLAGIRILQLEKENRELRDIIDQCKIALLSAPKGVVSFPEGCNVHLNCEKSRTEVNYKFCCYDPDCEDCFGF